MPNVGRGVACGRVPLDGSDDDSQAHPAPVAGAGLRVRPHRSKSLSEERDLGPCLPGLGAHHSQWGALGKPSCLGPAAVILTQACELESGIRVFSILELLQYLNIPVTPERDVLMPMFQKSFHYNRR